MENDLTISQAEKNKQPYILLWKYEKLYEEKYGKKPLLNKFRDKMNMKDVIESVGFEKAMDLMNYYFSLEKFGHPLQFFLYNFDKMEQARIELQKDVETRRLLRESTRKMVEEGGL
jgi:hypothetical protein